jgi:hypothetical protein
MSLMETPWEEESKGIKTWLPSINLLDPKVVRSEKESSLDKLASYQNADGSYARLTVEGTYFEEMDDEPADPTVAKSGKVISAANQATLHKAMSMVEVGAANVRKLMKDSGWMPAEEDSGDPAPLDDVGKVSVIVKGSFAATDDAQRVAYGFGVVATVNGEVVKDSQDDVIVDYASMEKAALDYALSDRAGKLMHKGDAVYSVPFVVPMTNEIAKSLGMTTAKEGILIGMHFPNTPEGDAGFALAKDGGGFSVGGKGERTPVK